MADSYSAKAMRDRLEAGEICNRNQAAEAYTHVLTMAHSTNNFEVAELNGAILKRWSPAGLRYIKERAWKIYDGGRA